MKVIEFSPGVFVADTRGDTDVNRDGIAAAINECFDAPAGPILRVIYESTVPQSTANTAPNIFIGCCSDLSQDEAHQIMQAYLAMTAGANAQIRADLGSSGEARH